MSTIHDNEKKKLIKEIVIYCRKLKKHAEKNKINLKNIWIMEGCRNEQGRTKKAS